MFTNQKALTEGTNIIDRYVPLYNDVSKQQDAKHFSFINLFKSDDRCQVAPVGSSVGALYQNLYVKSKVLLRMGEFVARNM
jgi:hypothetical protein